ncbi:Hypothetical predicted protein [Olea europaea subsp. europaea]|uniref:Uncharacterized protein n=1 Tax=Olea europaea subsp. europaea TaxID=158383 RepID=A0A8S0TKB7_OLEEU|nr:Hypothetical predicted protein [Olea europaea subsp. europaea]
MRAHGTGSHSQKSCIFHENSNLWHDENSQNAHNNGPRPFVAEPKHHPRPRPRGSPAEIFNDSPARLRPAEYQNSAPKIDREGRSSWNFARFGPRAFRLSGGGPLDSRFETQDSSADSDRWPSTLTADKTRPPPERGRVLSQVGRGVAWRGEPRASLIARPPQIIARAGQRLPGRCTSCGRPAAEVTVRARFLPRGTRASRRETANNRERVTSARLTRPFPLFDFANVKTITKNCFESRRGRRRRRRRVPGPGAKPPGWLAGGLAGDFFDSRPLFDSAERDGLERTSARTGQTQGTRSGTRRTRSARRTRSRAANLHFKTIKSELCSRLCLIANKLGGRARSCAWPVFVSFLSSGNFRAYDPLRMPLALSRIIPSNLKYGPQIKFCVNKLAVSVGPALGPLSVCGVFAKSARRRETRELLQRGKFSRLAGPKPHRDSEFAPSWPGEKGRESQLICARAKPSPISPARPPLS